MNKTAGAILSSAYFPPIEYFRVIARVGNVFLEANETFQKQTYRNRCKILAADGVLSLSIPLIKGEDRAIASMKIDYSKPWLQHSESCFLSFDERRITDIGHLTIPASTLGYYLILIGFSMGAFSIAKEYLPP